MRTTRIFLDVAKSSVRVRFAPSPTGHLHLGGLRTALFNSLFAKQHNGKLILRIEDTDQTRLVPGASAALDRILAWAGIDVDEGPSNAGNHGPYIQSERLDLYQKHANNLLDSGKAYKCYCSAERLDRLRLLASKTTRLTAYDGKCRNLSATQIKENTEAALPYTIRLKTPKDGKIVVPDMVYGQIGHDLAAIDDQVLMKSSGFPTYHLANVVDDHLMEISHVIRGEEWLSSCAKHILLYKAFGWDAPTFGHIPLLVNFDRSKLSKRQNDLRVESLRDQGYLPKALINFVGFLGWSSPKLQTEVYRTSDEIAEDFSMEAVSKSPSTVDMRKLKHLNKQHQLLLEPDSVDLENVVQVLHPSVLEKYSDRVKDKQCLEPSYLQSALFASCGTFDVFSDVVDCEYFWIPPDLNSSFAIDAKAKLQPEVLKVMESALQKFTEIPPDQFNVEAITRAVKAAAAESSVKLGKVNPCLRLSLTGKKSGPSIFNLVEVLGKDCVVDRLRTFVTASL